MEEFTRFYITYGLESKPESDLFQVFWQEAAKQCRLAGLAPLQKPENAQRYYTGHYQVEPDGTHPDPVDINVVESVAAPSLLVKMNRFHQKPLTERERRMRVVQGSLISRPYEQAEAYYQAFKAAYEAYEVMRQEHGLPDSFKILIWG